jgi:hypothetical protein
VRNGRLVHGDLLVVTTLHTLGEILSSQHGQEPELVRVLAPGRGGERHHPQIAADGGEHVAVHGDRPPGGPTGGYFSAAGPVPW